MHPIDRGVIIVSRRDSFLAWVNALPSRQDCPPLDLAALNSEPGVYLIPECDASAADGILARVLPRIWRSELCEWEQSETLWPKDLSFQRFHQWFQVSRSSLVMDLVCDSIHKLESPNLSHYRRGVQSQIG